MNTETNKIIINYLRLHIRLLDPLQGDNSNSSEMQSGRQAIFNKKKPTKSDYKRLLEKYFFIHYTFQEYSQ